MTGEKVAALAVVCTFAGGLLALFGMVFLNSQPLPGDDDDDPPITGGFV